MIIQVRISLKHLQLPVDESHMGQQVYIICLYPCEQTIFGTSFTSSISHCTIDSTEGCFAISRITPPSPAPITKTYYSYAIKI